MLTAAGYIKPKGGCQMFRKIILAISCLALLLTGTVFADVLITKQGTKYHSENCPLVANKDTQKISEEEAVAKGLTPCAKCIAKKQAKGEEVGVVFVTINGKKYHRQDCNLIAKRTTTGISLVDAKAKGLEPCGRCFSKKSQDK
jgi:uncharacterized protein (DUF1501 family)